MSSMYEKSESSSNRGFIHIKRNSKTTSDVCWEEDYEEKISARVEENLDKYISRDKRSQNFPERSVYVNTKACDAKPILENRVFVPDNPLQQKDWLKIFPKVNKEHVKKIKDKEREWTLEIICKTYVNYKDIDSDFLYFISNYIYSITKNKFIETKEDFPLTKLYASFQIVQKQNQKQKTIKTAENKQPEIKIEVISQKQEENLGGFWIKNWVEIFPKAHRKFFTRLAKKNREWALDVICETYVNYQEIEGEFLSFIANFIASLSKEKFLQQKYNYPIETLRNLYEKNTGKTPNQPRLEVLN